MSPLIRSDSVDALITHNLPGWMRQASEDHLSSLRRAMLQEQAIDHQVSQLWKAIPSLDAFARQMLEQKLSTTPLAGIDLKTAKLSVTTLIILPTGSPKLAQPQVKRVMKHDLLTAALHNFHADEIVPSIYRQARLTGADNKPLKMSFERFAHLCRQLDIGQRYQALLRQTLQPASHDSARKSVDKLLEASLRARLEVAVRLAFLKGQLDESSYLRMLPLCAARPIVPADPATVVPRQLYLLGKRIQGVVTVEVRLVGKDSVDSVIAWLPNDVQAPVQRYDSWSSLYRALCQKLRSPDYARYFSRFVGERDRVDFSYALRKRHAAGPEPSELDGRNLALDSTLFVHLRRLQVEKCLDDAAVLAVSTEAVDEQDRRRRLTNYKEFGLDLLGLAGLFVPVLGWAMLALTAEQVVENIYEGYKDWQIGDRQAALGHVFAVAQVVASGIAFAVGAELVGRTLKRVTAVDALAPICTVDGAVRLCRTDLPGFALKDSDLGIGQHETVDGVRQMRLHDATYVIEERADGTVLRHPSRSAAQPIALEHNGVGGWRHALESPHYWEGSGPLLRRLSSTLAQVPDALAEQLSLITGHGQAQLRRLHLEGAKPPARLLDALERLRLHEQFPRVKGAAFEEIVALRQAHPHEGARLLMRDFPGLTPRCAAELLELADDALVVRLLENKRVPLALAEQARWAVRDSRLDRACAGLLQPQAVNGDSERLALALARRYGNWPADMRVEIRDGHPDGVMLAANGAPDASRVATLVKQADRYLIVGGPGNGSGALLETLLALAEGQPGDVGAVERWQTRLARRAARARDDAAEMIGLTPPPGRVRPPVRLGDGRVGYLLSGRGESSGQALRRGIRQIYPTMSDARLEAFLADLRSHNIEPWGHFARLRTQLAELRTSLRQWEEQASGPLERLRRRRLATRLRRCWRRKSNIGTEDGYILHVDGAPVGDLPELPAGLDFSHVTQLTLRGLGLEEVRHAFISRFARVVELDLSGNRLSTIPAGVEGLLSLRELRLSHNRIVLDAQADARLSALERLERLHLDHNPLGQAPTVSGLPRLRELSLRSTGLENLPTRVQTPWRAFTDFRNNQLHRLNVELHALRERIRNMALHDNALEEVYEEGPSESSESSQGGGRGLSYRHALVDQTMRQQWLAGSTGALRAHREALWVGLQEEPGAQDFFRFLADFAQSTDLARYPGYYRARVWEIIEACAYDTEVRSAMFALAGGPRTCEDRLLWTLSQLETRAWVIRMTRGLPAEGAQAALVSLGRSLYRLDRLDGIAARHVQRLMAQPGLYVDELEVYLTYRINLAGPLQLPPQPRAMHYRSHSGVSNSDLNAARSEVLQAESPRLLSEALATQDFWETHARQQHAERFERMLAPFYARLATLEAHAEETGEMAYLLGSNTLRDELITAERRLLRTLAREAYGLPED